MLVGAWPKPRSLVYHFKHSEESTPIETCLAYVQYPRRKRSRSKAETARGMTEISATYKGTLAALSRATLDSVLY